MRTLIQGGWVVGYDGGGHTLIPDGCVVLERDRILHVGRAFDGAIDRRIDAAGKLVSPGFVNCHLHAATTATQSVFLDGLKTDNFGSNFLGYAVPRRGTAPPRAGDRAEVAGVYGMWSALRAGATTILDVGTMPGGPDAFTRTVGELGVRAYLGPGFRSASYVFDGSRVAWEWNEEQGRAGLRAPSPTRRRTTAPIRGASEPCSTPARWTRARWICCGRRGGGRTSWACPCSSTPP